MIRRRGKKFSTVFLKKTLSFFFLNNILVFDRGAHQNNLYAKHEIYYEEKFSFLCLRSHTFFLKEGAHSTNEERSMFSKDEKFMQIRRKSQP
jgi:hypothetical protein